MLRDAVTLARLGGGGEGTVAGARRTRRRVRVLVWGHDSSVMSRLERVQREPRDDHNRL